jgi:AraC-like DNA-binding protein
VEVVALLPPPLLSHLRIVLGSAHTVVAVSDWAQLSSTIRQRPVDVAVLDPRSADGVQLAELLSVIAQYPSLPVVLYTFLSPSVMSAVAELARHGVREVVLHRFDDEPRRFLELLERQPGFALGEMLLDPLAEPLSKLPTALARAIDRMFRTPSRVRDVGELARSAGMTVRMVYRKLDSVGFASPRTLVQSARLLRAYTHMRDPGLLLEDIASKLGYQSPRLLTRQMQEAVGMTPSEVRAHVSAEDFVSRLRARLLTTSRTEHLHVVAPETDQ